MLPVDEAEPEATPTAPEERAPALPDWPLNHLRLPTRVENWADKNGITTLRQLAAVAPNELIGERNLGRQSIAETRAVIESRLGAMWEDLASGAHAAADPAREIDLWSLKRWDELRVALPEEVRALPLDDIDLLSRVRAFAEQSGIRTLGELATRSEEDLLDVPHIGRRAVQLTFRAVRDGLARLAARLLAASPEHHGPGDVPSPVDTLAQRDEARRRLADTGLLESWKTLLAEQDAVPRMVMTRRAGLGGRAERLHTIGEMLGISRERVRQIESRAIEALEHEVAWLDAIHARAGEQLADGAVPLATLAADPWWAAAVALPEALDYFGERILDGHMRVVELDDVPLLARCSQAVLDAAWDQLRTNASQVAAPAPLSTFQALLDPLRDRLGARLSDALFDRLRGLLHIDETLGEPRVTAFGGTHATAFLALLRASPVPVRVEEIRARIGPGHMPEELLWLGHGLVGLEQHFPDFAAWMDRLVPAAVRVMERDAPERQWLAAELREELSEEIDIPDWLTDWHLGSLLRKSGRVRYLGRNRVALLDAPDVHGRVLYHEEVRRILHERGEPVSRGELLDALRKKTSISDHTLSQILARPQFLRCSADRYGLTDRDLPGGPLAIAEVTEHVAHLLAHRERGLGARQLWAEMARLGPTHAPWTPDMCLSVLRGDARFRLSKAGAVGLASWESVRVPTRLTLVGQCLEEGGGRVSVEAVQRRIEAYYGEAPGRVNIGAMANRFGAVLRGEWIEKDTDARPADEGG